MFQHCELCVWRVCFEPTRLWRATSQSDLTPEVQRIPRVFSATKRLILRKPPPPNQQSSSTNLSWLLQGCSQFLRSFSAPPKTDSTIAPQNTSDLLEQTFHGCSRGAADACYDTGVPLFPRGFLNFDSLRPLPKTDSEKNKTAAGWKIPWPTYTRRDHGGKNGLLIIFFPIILG